MPGWGNTIQILERYGFSNHAHLSNTTLFPAKKLQNNDYQKPSFIHELRLPEEKQFLIDAIITTSSRSKEAIESYVDTLISNTPLIAPVIMKKE